MTKAQKVIQKFIENPAGLSYTEIVKILEQAGFRKKQGKGSHVRYRKDQFVIGFAVHGNDCKAIYKKEALKVYQTCINSYPPQR